MTSRENGFKKVQELQRSFEQAFGLTSVQDLRPAIIKLNDDGSNPLFGKYQYSVPVIEGQGNETKPARFRLELAAWMGINNCPVLVFTAADGQLEIWGIDAARQFYAFGGAIPNPTGMTATPLIDKTIGQVKNAKIADEAVTVSKITFTPSGDTATENPLPRVVLDSLSGELSTVLDTVTDSVLPTIDEDSDAGYRIGSRIVVEGGAYVLHFVCLDPSPGAAIWYAENPRHTATTVDWDVDDDIDKGYIKYRSKWLNTSSGDLFVCIDDTVGAAVWEQINGAGGSGTVTSVGVSTNASYLTVGSTPVTTSGTITVNKTTGLTGNQVVATPDGTTGVADLRALVAGDIPNLAASKITSGQLALARGGTNADLSATGGSNQFLKQASSGAAITVGAISATEIQAALTSARAVQNTYTQYASVSVDATVTTAATTLSGTAVGSLTLAANRLAQGTTIEIIAAGRYSRATGSNGDILLKIGSATLTTLVMFDSTITDGGWVVRGNITCQSTGGSGTIVWSLDGTRNAQARTSTSLPASVTVDTTGTLALDVQCDWSNNVAGCICTCQQFIVNIIG